MGIMQARTSKCCCWSVWIQQKHHPHKSFDGSRQLLAPFTKDVVYLMSQSSEIITFWSFPQEGIGL